jgi:hypothetical protein
MPGAKVRANSGSAPTPEVGDPQGERPVRVGVFLTHTVTSQTR